MTGKEQRLFAEALEASRAGQYEFAIERAGRAVASGSAPEPRHLLGLLWCRVGQPGRGVEHLRSAYDAKPRNREFQLMLMRALIDCGCPNEALELPLPDGDDRDLWLARAEAADRAGRHDLAAIAWHALSLANPADRHVRLALARSLASANRLEESAAAYEELLATDPSNGVAVGELATLLERMSRIDILGSLIDRAAAAGVEERHLTYPRALLLARQGADSEAKRLLDGSAPASSPVHWLRLKAKVEDRLGNAAAAFAAAEAMNRLAADRDQWLRRAANYRAHLHRQAAALSETPLPPPLDPLPGLAPVFLLGFPRSGTTLLDTFLMGHPGLTVIEELPMLVESTAAIAGIDELTASGRAQLTEARANYLERLAAARDGPAGRAIDKFPLNLTLAPVISLLFPEARIIFVRRHPCDCVLSGFMQAFVQNVGMASFLDLGAAADFYDAALGLWNQSRESLPLNVHDVAFEELVSDPEATLRPLLDFLEVEWDPALLDHRASARARGLIPNTSYDQVTEALTSAPVERWRRYEDQLQSALPVLRPWAERLGYSM